MEKSFKSYRDLEVWQKAMDLVVECYRITKGFPRSETFDLQVKCNERRYPIPANIAEGQARTDQLKEFTKKTSVIGRMINGLRGSLGKKLTSEP